MKGDFTNQENVSVTKDDSVEKKNETEKDICKSVAQVQKPVPLKRQKYVKGKMALKCHPFVKTKSNKMLKVKPKFKSNVKKEISEKKETNEPKAQSEENRMAFIHAEMEDMIKQGKGVEESSQRKQTLENILAMLGATNGGEKKIEKHDIHKMDKPNTSNVVVSEVKEEALLIDDEDDDVNIEEEIKNEDCSDEFSSTDSSVKNIQESISKLIDTDDGDSGAKAAMKSVTFDISTCAQLDKSVEEEGAGEAADDTSSVDDLVIDLNQGQTVHSIVSDVVTEMVDTVVQQENKVINSGDPVDDCSDELSLTPPCSQMPRRDPYARQR